MRLRYFVVILAILLGCFSPHPVIAQPVAAQIIELPENVDTSYSIPGKFPFRLDLFFQGRHSSFITSRMDTMDLGLFDSCTLTGYLSCAPATVGQVCVFGYYVSGSLLVLINGDTLAATGLYQQPVPTQKTTSTAFVPFTFRQQMDTVILKYTSINCKYFSFTGSFGSRKWGQIRSEAKIEKDNNSFRQGFYYLSFTIVFFALFFFNRKKTEYFYFALFCLFISFANLDRYYRFQILRADLGIFGVTIPYFPLVFAFSFLAMFFSVVISNRKPSTVPLRIVTVFAAICLIPSVSEQHFYLDYPTGYYAAISRTVFLGLAIYLLIVNITRLLRGVKNKQWDARLLLLFFAIPLIGLALSPFISTLFRSVGLNIFAGSSFDSGWEFAFNLAFYMYPVGVALILGRRNYITQSQLEQQIVATEQLSADNLARELEKKDILERQNTMLEEQVALRTSEMRYQKELVEEKSKLLLDNIQYARRIQNAILPDQQQMKEYFPRHFIYYKPRDIVSGDFYAIIPLRDQLILAVADCTGHGVSGALMSMVGSSLLNQVVLEKGITDPGCILMEMSKLLMELLNQEQSANNDGMDMVICVLNKNSDELLYAGANRPLWIYRGDTIEVVKPDKYPIGGAQMGAGRQYTTHNLKVLPGNVLYLFTDGYADQFGGPNGKKIMTANMRNLLHSNADRPLQEQGAELECYFNKWQNNQDQVDDVLVMGVGL